MALLHSKATGSNMPERRPKALRMASLATVTGGTKKPPLCEFPATALTQILAGMSHRD
jgi:hypothetical protein